MLKKDLNADQTKDDSAGELGLVLEPKTEQISDLQSERGKSECPAADARR